MGFPDIKLASCFLFFVVGVFTSKAFLFRNHIFGGRNLAENQFYSKKIISTKERQISITKLNAIQTDSSSPSKGTETSSTTLEKSSQLKDKLLELFPIGSLEDKIKADSLIEKLEASYFPIHTLDFFNLGMKGKWQLVYSTFPIRNPAADLSVPQLSQEIIPNGQNGTLVNSFTWEEHDTNTKELTSQGNFSIKAEYQVTPRSHMDITVNKHLMLPSKMPKDPEATINKFQTSIPPEYMNPDDCLVETKYCDVDMRIVQFVGENLSGIKNVFLRDGEIDLS